MLNKFYDNKVLLKLIYFNLGNEIKEIAQKIVVSSNIH